MRKPFVAILLLSACTHPKSNQTLKEQTAVKPLLACDGNESNIYHVKESWLMGQKPRVKLLKHEKKDVLKENPEPLDWNKYVRAASGVGTGKGDQKNAELLVVQDSRREIARIRIPIQAFTSRESKFLIKSDAITMVPVSDKKVISELENRQRDYDSFRKKKKADYEAITTLPDGRFLVVGSGSDINSSTQAESLRADAIVFDESGKFTTYSLLEFYKIWLSNQEILGHEQGEKKPIPNVEGVAIREIKGQKIITFAHRGNINGNGYNSLIDYDFNTWISTLMTTSPKWTEVHPLKVTAIQLPEIKINQAQEKVNIPVTLDDLLATEEGVLIPVGAEAEYVDQSGVHHDGEVVYSAILKIDRELKTCKVYRAHGDNPPGMKSKFSKFEGLTLVKTSKGNVLIAVNDADSELEPSRLAMIDLH